MTLAKQSQFIPLQNVVYFISLHVLVRKIFPFSINDVLLFKFNFQGQRFECPRGMKLSGNFFFWSPIMRFQVPLKRINEEGACVTEMECIGFGVEVNKPLCICNNMGFLGI